MAGQETSNQELILRKIKTFNSSKVCVVTHIFNSNGRQLLDISEYFLIRYSQNIKADYFCIDETGSEGAYTWYRSLRVFSRLLNLYERIIYIDPDIIVREDCPDLTKICPPHLFGAYFESDTAPRTSYIEAGKLIYGDIKEWNSDYFNMGVMVLSKCHLALFDEPKLHLLSELHIQTYLNWMLFHNDLKYFKLDTKYNWMPGPLGGISADAQIVHFAGMGRLYGKLLLAENHIDAWVEKKIDAHVDTVERIKDAAILSIKILQMQDMVAALLHRKIQFSIGLPMFGTRPAVGRFLDERGIVYGRLPNIELEYALYGPYISLMPGHYRIVVNATQNDDDYELLLDFDITSNTGRISLLTKRNITLRALMSGLDFFIFSIAEDVEFRFSLHGKGFNFYSVRVESV